MRRCLLLSISLSAFVVSGCASTGATPQPFPRPAAAPVPAPEPDSAAPAAPSAIVLVGTALSLRGAPYRDGGNTPSGFDCSGFVEYVFGQQGQFMPRTVSEQFLVGAEVGPRGVNPRRSRVFQHDIDRAVPCGDRDIGVRVRPCPQLLRGRARRVPDGSLLGFAIPRRETPSLTGRPFVPGKRTHRGGGGAAAGRDLPTEFACNRGPHPNPHMPVSPCKH